MRTIQGFLVDRARLIALPIEPDARRAAESAIARHVDGFDLEADARARFDSDAVSVLDYIFDGGEAPGRSCESGGVVSYQLMELCGERMSSSLLNSIGSDGAQLLDDELAACGSPVRIFGEGDARYGPWGVSDDDSWFFGGYDAVTLKSAVDAIEAALLPAERSPRTHLLWWLNKAVETDTTLWALYN